MPTYEYSCNECGTYGSQHRTFKEGDGGMTCPKCNLEMSRIFSAPGLIFKGDGWGSKP
jgi:putative FmdB family regulatory protein